jgi:hypothetical protein
MPDFNMADICEHNFARFQHGRHPSTQYPPDILTLQIKNSVNSIEKYSSPKVQRSRPSNVKEQCEE